MANMNVLNDRKETSKPGLDVRTLVNILMRRLPIFMAVAVAVVLIALTASLIIRPVYQATANVRIDPNQKSALDLASIAQGAPPDQALVDSEVRLIRSSDVARGAIGALGLLADPEFNPKLHGRTPLTLPALSERDKEAVVQRVLGRLEVAREGSTYIIDIRVKSESPSKAASIANAIAQQYIWSSAQSRAQLANAQSAGLQSRLAALDDEVKRGDAAVAAYRAQNGIISSTSGGTITEQQIATVSQEYSAAESDAAEAKSKYDAALAQIRQSGIGSVSSVLSAPTIVDMRRQLADLSRKQAEINARYGPKHPDSITIAQQVAGLNAQIRDESQQIVNGLQSDARAAEARAASLRANLNQLKGEQAGNSRADVVADGMAREVEAKRNTYNQLAASVQQASQQGQSSQSQAQLIATADAPLHPIFPKKSLFLAFGVVLGMLAGAGAVLLLEMFDSGLRNADDVERVFGVNCIASIPLLKPRALEIDGRTVAPRDYVLTRPMSGYAEAMRSIRAAINLSEAGDGQRNVLIVTSALPGEGKTACSVALARTLAMSGERVLLIDGDLRRNSLADLVSAPPAAGLVQVLSDAAPLDQAIVADVVPGLDLLCIYKSTFSPRDLFGDQRMVDLLDEVRARYDRIVIDAPPLLAVSDARTLSALADRVVMIVRADHTPQKAVQAALTLITQDANHLVGIALSMVEKRSGGMLGGRNANDYYEHYRQYYQD